MARHDEFKNIFCREVKDFSRDISRRRVPSSVVVVYLRTLKIIPHAVLSFEYPYAPMKWNLKEKSAC